MIRLKSLTLRELRRDGEAFEVKSDLEKRSGGWGAPARRLVRGGVVIEGGGKLPDDVRGRLQREGRGLKKTVRELLMELAQQAGSAG